RSIDQQSALRIFPAPAPAPAPGRSLDLVPLRFPALRFRWFAFRALRLHGLCQPDPVELDLPRMADWTACLSSQTHDLFAPFAPFAPAGPRLQRRPTLAASPAPA